MMNLSDFFRISYTKDPQVAAALGYRNPGTDRRIAGELGAVLGGIQAALSYKSLTRPVIGPLQVLGSRPVYVQTETDPSNGNAYYKVATRQRNGRWATIRVGYHYDGNWGDEHSIPDDTDPSIVGGYIFDVIVKLNATQSFIEGVG